MGAVDTKPPKSQMDGQTDIMFENILVPIPISSYTSRTFRTSTGQCFRNQSLLEGMVRLSICTFCSTTGLGIVTINIVKKKTKNDAAANVALNSFLRHLLYLNDTMIGLAFFDDEVQVDSKELMVAALSLEGKDEPCKRIHREHKDIGTKKLSDFVTTNTS